MIDDALNITLNLATDFIFPLVVKEDGVAQNMSAADIKLVVQNRFTILPTVDPEDATRLQFHFMPTHAAQVRKEHQYIVVLTENGVRDELMSGKIKSEGFAV